MKQLAQQHTAINSWKWGSTPLYLVPLPMLGWDTIPFYRWENGGLEKGWGTCSKALGQSDSKPSGHDVSAHIGKELLGADASSLSSVFNADKSGEQAGAVRANTVAACLQSHSPGPWSKLKQKQLPIHHEQAEAGVMHVSVLGEL